MEHSIQKKSLFPSSLEAQFVTGIIGTNPITDKPYQKAAFIGRSNAGKSSVINALVGRKSLVKTSRLPGKTREINFFLIAKKIFFIDLPGYGYAKIRDKKKDKLRKLIIWFFTESGITLKKVFVIVDATVGLTPIDQEMLAILTENNYPVVIVANKIDKLRKNDVSKVLKTVEEAAGNVPVMPFSAVTKEYRDELLEVIF